MRRFLTALAAVLSGCGYVAGPLPPLANIPARVTDLAAVQRGGKLIVQFTVPQLTTEGRHHQAVTVVRSAHRTRPRSFQRPAMGQRSEADSTVRGQGRHGAS